MTDLAFGTFARQEVMMRTHRPLGKWPHVTRKVFLRRVRIALLATLIAIPLVTIAFSFWAASPPPNGNGGTPLDHFGEAFKAALLLAVAIWAVGWSIFGMVRWIVTGESPDHTIY